MIRIASVAYSTSKDNTRFTVAPAYDELDPLTQADIMRDLKNMVDAEYAEAVERLGESIERQIKNRKGIPPITATDRE